MSGTSVDGSISAALIRTDGDEFVERLAALEYTYESGDVGASRPVHHFTKAAELAFRDAKGDHARAKELYAGAVVKYFRQTFPKDSEPEREERKRRYQEEFLARVPKHSTVTLEAVIECSTILHAEAVERLLTETRTAASEVSFIGYHGQTLYHAPFDKITVQVGDAPYLAHRVGIPVMYDFRSNDVAHGGQGAPLAPVYHRALARQAGFKGVCILNLGGTANITAISECSQAIVAFDTGPANGLLDKWVKERAQQAFDVGSQFATKGCVNSATLQVLLERAIVLADGRNYLDIPVPKSLDIRDYHYNFPEMMRLSLEDGCATLNAFTAECIVRGLAFVSDIPQRWVVCGGGVHNVYVLNEVRKRVKARYGVEIELLSADAVGWSSAAMEAELFAFLAVRCDRGLPITYPYTTGVVEPLTGGRRQQS